ncbi:uncharacterized protein TM35_000016640 [Trypanosoma theileri]|uniref:Uncharacterized protein n=1 Tax=Trypanosoma theileri TaxID=67003 RepID=A0A1X0PA22_9TRYP|nr:uncharacterized protein TM35_000016640 [Trypanosoma theileri]ORC93787.1 hypothetical protein TM35_000016640 [Trypanosoma theileri]
MSSKYLCAPENISRFIEMSSHRSLSPQREISQMTAHIRPPQTKRRRDDESHDDNIAKHDDTLQQVEHHEENTIENTAYLLQCGSPLYDPVKEGWRCWNNHELRIKEREQYGPVDGVSCDFCGFTDWLEGLEEAEEEKKSTKGKKRGGRKKPKTKMNEKKYLYHCDVCDMDLCIHCARELRDDSRYHVPCMQCKHCLMFMRSDDAVMHRCHATIPQTEVTHRLVTSSASTSGGATSSTNTESARIQDSSEGSVATPTAVALSVSPLRRPNTAWELCVTFETTGSEAKVRLIGQSFGMEEVEMPKVSRQLVFRTRTRLAAEEFAQRIHSEGLFTSLRRFRE